MNIKNWSVNNFDLIWPPEISPFLLEVSAILKIYLNDLYYAYIPVMPEGENIGGASSNRWE